MHPSDLREGLRVSYKQDSTDAIVTGTVESWRLPGVYVKIDSSRGGYVHVDRLHYDDPVKIHKLSPTMVKALTDMGSDAHYVPRASTLQALLSRKLISVDRSNYRTGGFYRYPLTDLGRSVLAALSPTAEPTPCCGASSYVDSVDGGTYCTACDTDVSAVKPVSEGSKRHMQVVHWDLSRCTCFLPVKAFESIITGEAGVAFRSFCAGEFDSAVFSEEARSEFASCARYWLDIPIVAHPRSAEDQALPAFLRKFIEACESVDPNPNGYSEDDPEIAPDGSPMDPDAKSVFGDSPVEGPEMRLACGLTESADGSLSATRPADLPSTDSVQGNWNELSVNGHPWLTHADCIVALAAEYSPESAAHAVRIAAECESVKAFKLAEDLRSYAAKARRFKASFEDEITARVFGRYVTLSRDSWAELHDLLKPSRDPTSLYRRTSEIVTRPAD